MATILRRKDVPIPMSQAQGCTNAFPRVSRCVYKVGDKVEVAAELDGDSWVLATIMQVKRGVQGRHNYYLVKYSNPQKGNRSMEYVKELTTREFIRPISSGKSKRGNPELKQHTGMTQGCPNSSPSKSHYVYKVGDEVKVATELNGDSWVRATITRVKWGVHQGRRKYYLVKYSNPQKGNNSMEHVKEFISRDFIRPVPSGKKSNHGNPELKERHMRRIFLENTSDEKREEAIGAKDICLKKIENNDFHYATTHTRRIEALTSLAQGCPNPSPPVRPYVYKVGDEVLVVTELDGGSWVHATITRVKWGVQGRRKYYLVRYSNPQKDNNSMEYVKEFISREFIRPLPDAKNSKQYNSELNQHMEWSKMNNYSTLDMKCGDRNNKKLKDETTAIDVSVGGRSLVLRDIPRSETGSSQHMSQVSRSVGLHGTNQDRGRCIQEVAMKMLFDFSFIVPKITSEPKRDTKVMINDQPENCKIASTEMVSALETISNACGADKSENAVSSDSGEKSTMKSVEEAERAEVEKRNSHKLQILEPNAIKEVSSDGMISPAPQGGDHRTEKPGRLNKSEVNKNMQFDFSCTSTMLALEPKRKAQVMVDEQPENYKIARANIGKSAPETSNARGYDKAEIVISTNSEEQAAMKSAKESNKRAEVKKQNSNKLQILGSNSIKEVSSDGISPTPQGITLVPHVGHQSAVKLEILNKSEVNKNMQLDFSCTIPMLTLDPKSKAEVMVDEQPEGYKTGRCEMFMDARETSYACGADKAEIVISSDFVEQAIVKSAEETKRAKVEKQNCQKLKVLESNGTKEVSSDGISPAPDGVKPIGHVGQQKVVKPGRWNNSPFVDYSQKKQYHISEHMNQIYNEIIRHGSKSRSKRKNMVIVKYPKVDIELSDLADSIKPNGKMSTLTAQGILYIQELEHKEKGKLILPYWIAEFAISNQLERREMRRHFEFSRGLVAVVSMSSKTACVYHTTQAAVGPGVARRDNHP
ncbi:hypothetical protein ACP4OV_027289 [Aristida adscensionis]